MLASWGGYGAEHGAWILAIPLFWVAVIAALALLFRRRRNDSAVRSGEAALAERFARGEITEDEYRQRRRILRERLR